MGCVIGYRSFAEGYPPNAAGMGTVDVSSPGIQEVCVNPAELRSNPDLYFSRSYFPLDVNNPFFNVGDLIEIIAAKAAAMP